MQYRAWILLVLAACGGKDEPRETAEAKPEQSLEDWVTGRGGRLTRDDGFAGVDLWETDVGDHDLKRLEGLKGLRRLNLGGTRVTDAGLLALPVYRKLRSLNLNGTKGVMGPGLERVGEWTYLDHIHLRNTRVDDDSLRHLAGLRRVKDLYLSGTRVTDAGLEQIAVHRNLDTLGLGSLPITDLEPLRGLDRLTTLLLDDTRVGDDALEHLGKLWMLDMLELQGTLVTDAGLVHLRTLRALRSLALPRGVTGKGLRHLTLLKALESVTMWTSTPDRAAVRDFKRARPAVNVTVEGDGDGPGGEPR